MLSANFKPKRTGAASRSFLATTRLSCIVLPVCCHFGEIKIDVDVGLCVHLFIYVAFYAAFAMSQNVAVYCECFHVVQLFHFLADRTIGRAFVTGCRLSVCRLSVTFCIQAKRLDRFA